jgi:hypothetical protein
VRGGKEAEREGDSAAGNSVEGLAKVELALTILLCWLSGEARGTAMDYLDSGTKILQVAIPPAIQYFGKAKEREAKLAQTQEELAQSRAHIEVLVMKQQELTQVHDQVKVQVKVLEATNQELLAANQELLGANQDLEAFRNIVVVLVIVVAVAYVGMKLKAA